LWTAAFTADTPGPWLAAALAAAGVTRSDAGPAEPFAGIDTARPIVLALAEAPDDAPSRSFAAGLPLVTGALPGLRHELVLPAADVALLRRSLGALLDSLGAARPELVAGHPDASGWQLGDVPVALLAGGDHVRLVAVTHALHVEAPPAATPALLRTPAAPPLRTAGLIAAARSDAPLSVLMRTRAQARLALWQIAREGLLDARSRLPTRPSQRVAIQRALRCETLLRDSGREFEDWTIGVMADDAALGLRVVASLGDAGVAVFDAGAAASGAVREPLGDDLLAHAWLRIAPDAMLTAARGESSPMVSIAELVLFTASCGGHLPALLGATPFAHLQQPYAQIRSERAEETFGAALQIAVRERAPGALHSAVSIESTGAAGPWERVWPLVADGLGGPPQIVQTPGADGRIRLDVGFGGPASALLGPLAPDDEGLMGVHLRFASLRARLADRAELGPLLARDHLHADLRRSGRALVGRLTLAAAAAAAAPLDLSHVTWSERQPPPPPGEACGVQAALQAAAHIGDPAALGAAASERIVRQDPGIGGTAALDAIEAALRCPEPLPAATAANLRRLSALALAGGLVDEWRIDEATRLLERALRGDPRRAAVQPRRRGEGDDRPAHPRRVHSLRGPRAPRARAPRRHQPGRARARRPPRRRPRGAAPGARGPGRRRERRHRPRPRHRQDHALRRAPPPPHHAGDDQGPAPRGRDPGELSERGPALRLKIGAMELGDAARSGEPPRSLRDQAGTLVLAVEGEAIRLRTGMINLGVDPNPSPGSLHFDTLTRVSNGEPPLVHATDDAPWSTVTIALAGSCSDSKLVEPAREQALLGPAWRDADCLAVYHGPRPLSVVPPHRGPNNINSALIGVRPKFEACYAAGLIDDPQLAGRVIATYRVTAEGEVTESAVTSKALAAPAVLQCMADAIRTASHSGADGPVVVRYAFDFATKPR
jgi:hypothetical protein